MTEHVKRAKLFMSLGAVFGFVSIACGVAAVVQLVRGFFDYGQWLYMIGWILGSSIFKTVAFSYRNTSRKIMRDAAEPGQ